MAGATCTPEQLIVRKIRYMFPLFIIKVMSEQRVVLALLSYVRPIDASLKTSWTPAQYEELQLQVHFLNRSYMNTIYFFNPSSVYFNFLQSHHAIFVKCTLQIKSSFNCWNAALKHFFFITSSYL